mmetsp:Transcript_43250/g.31588  ORF Transcript_43250/g.31588 Transcript_43250/m.31588 type:complete len:99 (-) Transcript_43250:465-761(-)
MIYAFLVYFIVTIFLIAEHKTTCYMNNTTINVWLFVASGSYLTDFILLLAQYHHIKKTRKESVIVILIRFFFSCFLVSWLIFGNVLYFSVNDCNLAAY